jgi:3-hydroxybutyryl-CoA dehydrogenase
MNQRKSQSMAVIGGGTMGVGIAYVFAVAGWQVYVVEPDDQRSLGMFQTLKDAAAGGLKRGKLSAAQAELASDGVQTLAAVVPKMVL